MMENKEWDNVPEINLTCRKCEEIEKDLQKLKERLKERFGDDEIIDNVFEELGL